MKSPVLRDVPTSLDTERLHLRVPRTGDGQIVFEAVSESLSELRRFLASLPWLAGEYTLDTAETFCRTSQANHLARTDLPYLVFRRDTGRLVGCAGLHRPVWNTPKLEVGYWGRTSETGHGHITEAVNALVNMAFEQLGAARIELVVDAENTASRRVADRCGFALDGVLRSERRAPDGSLRDTCIYSRIAKGPVLD
ncbi:MAG: GNAT family N-acetyltransferase [Trueperaceae bacterium]|nr:GNAT family N-acetyltransferase [Trueperaceae bacterium]